MAALILALLETKLSSIVGVLLVDIILLYLIKMRSKWNNYNRNVNTIEKIRLFLYDSSTFMLAC